MTSVRGSRRPAGAHPTISVLLVAVLLAATLLTTPEALAAQEPAP